MYMRACVQFSYNMLFALENPCTPTSAEMHLCAYMSIHSAQQHSHTFSTCVL